MQVIARLFSTESLKSPTNPVQPLLGQTVGYADSTPVFIVGMPRSGSTLIEQIVSSHPDAWGAGGGNSTVALCPEPPCL